jgi:GT2 family glycosyltransferase
MSNVVIIPVHNQLPYLIKCVETVLHKTKDLELIIVDDGSTDKECIEWIERNELPLNFHRIRHEKAMGFSKSCNDGIDFAMEKFDFICLCLLNSDTEIVTESWFDKVLLHYENGEKIGVAGVMSDSALAQTVNHKNEYLARIDKKPSVHSYLIHGFCYFIARELIMTIGKLDEDMFPHYGSEDDYSLSAIEAGFTNIVIGSVFVHHNNATSYSNAKRSVIVKKSYPDLISRWGNGFVDRCGVQSVRAGKYINNQ